MLFSEKHLEVKIFRVMSHRFASSKACFKTLHRDAKKMTLLSLKRYRKTVCKKLIYMIFMLLNRNLNLPDYANMG